MVVVIGPLAGYQVETRDQADDLADIFPEMGQGLAEWIITAPDGQRHCRSANNKQVSDHSAVNKPFAQFRERVLQLGAAEQEVAWPAHAASRSRADR
jgi:hypothetical protein